MINFTGITLDYEVSPGVFADKLTGVSVVAIPNSPYTSPTPTTLGIHSIVRSLDKDSLMYAPGTQNDDIAAIPLQEQTTVAAIFLKN